MKPPIDGMTVRPWGPDDLMMQGAFIACVKHALGEDEIIAEFRKETGIKWTPPKNGLDAMIDEATGAQREFFTKFADWVAINIWGEEE